MAKRLVFVGAGDLGREILAWMLHANPSLSSEVKLCFVDDNIDCMSAAGLVLASLGSIQCYIPQPEDKIVFSIANPTSSARLRLQIMNEPRLAEIAQNVRALS